MDPITSFTSIGDRTEVKAMIIRLLDHLKGLGITIVMPSLTPGSSSDEETETEVSSMVDAWVIVHFVRKHGTRRRVIYVHKARGIGHSLGLASWSSPRRGSRSPRSSARRRPEATMTDRTMAPRDGAPGEGAATWELRLFVAGSDLEVERVQNALEKVCQEHVPGRYRIAMVDILQDPEQADAFDIVAAPTLIRQSPLPGQTDHR